jgi:hypothetical protein
MGKVKFRYCICCKTNRVSNLRKKDCVYCRNCSRHNIRSYNKNYFNLRNKFKKKYQSLIDDVEHVISILRSQKKDKIRRIKKIFYKNG